MVAVVAFVLTLIADADLTGNDFMEAHAPLAGGIGFLLAK
jgi:hypothetical protein